MTTVSFGAATALTAPPTPAEALIPETATNTEVDALDPRAKGLTTPVDELMTDAEREAMAHPEWEHEGNYDLADLDLEEKPEAGAEQPPAAAQEGDDQPAAAQQFDAPELNIPVPPDLAPVEAEFNTLNQKYADLDRRYEDGEISEAEWRRESGTLARQIGAKEAQLEHVRGLNAEYDTKIGELWTKASHDFMAAYPQIVAPEHLEAFQDTLRRMTDPKNSIISHLPFAKQLEKVAHEYANTVVGNPDLAKPATKPHPNPAPRTPEKGSKPRRNAPARTEQPPVTLGGMPNSDANAPSMSRFSYLDGLSGSQLESAIAKMSADDQAAWLAGG